MKNLLLVLVLALGFTSCLNEELIEAPVSECTQIEAQFTQAIADALNAAPGYVADPNDPAYDFDEQSELYIQVASQFIADWQAALAAAGCPNDSL